MKKILLILLTSLSIVTCALSVTVTLLWDRNVDSGVTGYHIQQGIQVGVYTNIIDVGNNVSLTVTNLVPGTTYHFVGSAYTIGGLEGPNSVEAITNIPPLINPTNTRPGAVKDFTLMKVEHIY